MKIFTWKQRIIVLGITLITIGIFSAIGYFIGHAAGNWKAGLCIGIILSYPISQLNLAIALNRRKKTPSNPIKID